MPDRDRQAEFKRGFGSPVLWGLVQAFVAAGFYFSAGLVAQRAGGLTWAVYLVAALLFLLTAMSYVEGASLHQERGGATVLARYAYNEVWSFVAGWAILLDYLILIALTAFAATSYLAVFWEPLSTGASGVLAAVAVIVGVALTNLRGIDPGRFQRFFFFALADLGVQVLLLVVGAIVLFDPAVLASPREVAGDVGLSDLVFAFPLAAVAFTALDASSGFAGQIRVSRSGLRRLLGVRAVSLLVAYLGLALVVSSVAAVPNGPADHLDAPLVGVVDAIDQATVREVLRPIVAISATLVLFSACTAAMLGLSRLGYSLAVNRQIPSAVGRLHPRYRTPWVLIVIGAVLAVALVIPEDLEFLAAIYAFGATLAFTLVHASVLTLRRREPDRDRPFRIPLDVRVRGVAYPLPAVLGLLLCALAFVSVLALHDSARIVGPLWMLLGIALYVSYRRGSDKPLTRRLTVPELSLTRREGPEAEYGSILVPVLGIPLDDDIMQTAGRLAAEEDDDEAGAQIEAVWVTIVPVALPLDGRLPEADLKHARRALARAKAVGEEYEGVTVNPFTVRARSAGEAIVREARRRGVEAIVMPAEEPTQQRGGMVLGGREGLHSTFIGETTRYVVTKAPCRVILTAPPDPGARRKAQPTPSERPGAPPPSGDPMRPLRGAGRRLRRRADSAAPRSGA